ncbi:MAG: GNAT family N-acetyltransferase [Nocardioidaceae bacterium]
MEDDVSALRTERLLLRRTLDGDLAAYREVHGDPATSTCRRAGAATPQECADRVSESVHRWDDVGLDYWTVVERLTGDILGFGGLRSRETDGYVEWSFRAPEARPAGEAKDAGTAVLDARTGIDA